MRMIERLKKQRKDAKPTFKVGDEVRVAKPHGKWCGSCGCNHYKYGSGSRDLSVGSIGRIVAIQNGTETALTVRFPDTEFVLDPSEIEYVNLMNKIGLPMPPLVELLENDPLLIFDDRLWVPSSNGKEKAKQGDAAEKTGQGDAAEKVEPGVSIEVGAERHSLEESAQLSALEQLYLIGNAEEIEKFKADFIKEVLKDEEDTARQTAATGGRGRETNTTQKMKIIKLLFDEVFPILRKKEGDGLSKKLERQLGQEDAREVENNGEAPARAKKEATTEKAADPAIERERQRIIGRLKERIAKKLKELEQKKPEDVTSRKKRRILDMLVGDPIAETHLSITPPKSLFGSTLLGMNALICGDRIYALTDKGTGKNVTVTVGGKRYSVVELPDLLKRLETYLERIDTELRIAALRSIDDSYLATLAPTDQLAYVLSKGEYSENDFGFVEYNSYIYAYLWVPQHIHKVGGVYYRFSKVRVATALWHEEGTIKLGYQAAAIEPYIHPFTAGNGFQWICLGNYNYDALRNLAKATAIAKLLRDARNTLMFGYFNMGGHTPVRTFDQLGRFAISKDEAERLRAEGVNVFDVYDNMTRRRRDDGW